MRFGVLYLCVHNAGRSQMAAAFTAAWAKPGVVVMSAGSAPGAAVNPMAAAAMAEVGIPLDGAVPKKWTMEMLHDEVAMRVRAFLAERDLLADQA